MQKTAQSKWMESAGAGVSSAIGRAAQWWAKLPPEQQAAIKKHGTRALMGAGSGVVTTALTGGGGFSRYARNAALGAIGLPLAAAGYERAAPYVRGAAGDIRAQWLARATATPGTHKLPEFGHRGQRMPATPAAAEPAKLGRPAPLPGSDYPDLPT